MKAGTVLSVTGAAGQVSAFAVWLGRTTPVPQLDGSGEGAVTAGTAAGLPARSAALAGVALKATIRAPAAITNPKRVLRIAFSFRRESPARKAQGLIRLGRGGRGRDGPPRHPTESNRREGPSSERVPAALAGGTVEVDVWQFPHTIVWT